MKTLYIIGILTFGLFCWWVGYHEGKCDVGWINELSEE
jgi:hypothetical protein